MSGQDFDVIVLGGGIGGVSVLAELAPRLRVALVEREPALAYHTTGRSAAMFAPGYGAPAAHGLAAASERFFRAPAEDFAEPLMSPRPVMHIAGPGQIDALIRIARRRAREPLLRWLTPDEALGQAPILRARRLSAALIDSGGGDIDVMRLHEGYVRRARRFGASVFAGVGALRLERRANGWRVVAEHTAWRAPVLVNATGAWADETALAAGVRPLALAPLARTVILVEAPKEAGFGAWPTVMDAAERFYFRPFAGRLLITAADETPSPPCDAAADELQVALGLARFAEACAHPIRNVENRWAGLRTFAADRAPVIGWDPGAPGFFWHAALGGVGIQTAPAAARLAAALILGEAPPADLLRLGVDPARFDPGRALAWPARRRPGPALSPRTAPG